MYIAYKIFMIILVISFVTGLVLRLVEHHSLSKKKPTFEKKILVDEEVL